MLRSFRFKESFNIKFMVLGAIIAVCISLILSAIAGMLINYGKVDINISAYIIMLVYFVSVILSCTILNLITRNKNQLQCIGIGVGYMLLLLMTNLLLFSNGVYNFIYLMIGSAAGIIVSLMQNRQQMPKNKRIKKMRFR